jgi:serine/threonine-protein kinase
MKDLSGAGGGEGGRKLTRTGMIFGTPEYMSPEQAAGKPIDHRVDIYAVGVIMYETLAGRVPFIGDSFMGVLTQHMFENAPPIKQLRPEADVPGDLESVIAKALAIDPTHRYQTMQEVADDLARIRDGLRPAALGASIPGAARPTATGYIPSGSADGTSRLGAANTPPVGPVSHTLELESPKRRSPLLMIGLGALLLAGGGVAIAVTRGGGAGNGGTAATRNVPTGGGGAGTGSTGTGGGGTQAGAGGTGGGAGTPITPVVADAGAIAQGTPDAGSSTTVRVHVATTNGNGHVEVEGQSDLSCEQTPCDLTLPRGHEVHLIATARNRRGELSYTASHDGDTIAIAMNTIGAPAHPPAGGTHPSGGTGSHPHAGGCRPGQLHLDPSTGLMVPCFLPGDH